MGYSIPLRVFFCKSYFNCPQCFECSVLNDLQQWKIIWITKFVKDFEVYPWEKKPGNITFLPSLVFCWVSFFAKMTLIIRFRRIYALLWGKQKNSGETSPSAGWTVLSIGLTRDGGYQAPRWHCQLHKTRCVTSLPTTSWVFHLQAF